MPSTFGIVDLFAGPGGLGEGFSAFRDESSGENPFSIEISIEKDPAAHATLRLRSFLRKFDDKLPPEYYEFLNGGQDEPDWSRLYPDQWKEAEQETLCMELGRKETDDVLKSRIARIRRERGNRTILIGGPPCQAYSLVGRARNAGVAGYAPHEDERNFLYQKYVDVLRRLEPAAFVMENVKGMLSSSIKGDLIFRKVSEDLGSALGPDSYRLLALVPRPSGAGGDGESSLPDYVVRMENHGVPQARHRVIVVGLHRDFADCSPSLSPWNRSVAVGDVIEEMPRLRSGLSRNDDFAAWREVVMDAIVKVSSQADYVPERHRNDFVAALEEAGTELKAKRALKRISDCGVGLANSCPPRLRDWLLDCRLERLPNHDSRGHMPSDLARYLFASAFGVATGRSPKAADFPASLAPNHGNWRSGKFADRFKVQVSTKPASTITSHISKDGHYYIHPDPSQCRSLTVREAARLQTFPDNYFFKGNRTQDHGRLRFRPGAVDGSQPFARVEPIGSSPEIPSA